MLNSTADYVKHLLGEAFFRVRWQGKTKYFRTGKAAHAYADRYDDAKVDQVEKLPDGATLSESREDLMPLVHSFGHPQPDRLMDFMEDSAAEGKLEEMILKTCIALFEADHKTMAPDGKVYQVIWADGRGVQYFDNLEAAKEFQGQKDRDAREPRLIDKPARARVKSEAPELKESNQSLLESEVTISGDHPHPHGFNGAHQHQALPAGGGHAHTPETFGAHRHRPGDPLDGQHLNIGNGAHDHLLAKGMTEYIEWSIKVHLEHPWIPGFKRAWIRHISPPPEETEFRVAEADDWREHTIWWMHSTGVSNSKAHAAVFLDADTRFIIKEYEMDNGSRRPATAEDFAAEAKWFQDNTPQQLRDRLIEMDRYEATGKFLPDARTVCAGQCEGMGCVPVPAPTKFEERYGRALVQRPNPADDEPWLSLWLEAEAKNPTDDGWHFVRCPECNGTGERSAESHFAELEKDVNVRTQSDIDLGEDWRLLNAKYSTMKDGGKTEFADFEELEKLGAKIMREILDRGKMTFKPEGAKPRTLELLRALLGRVIKDAVVLPAKQAQALRSRKIKMTLFGSAAPRLEKFLVLVADGKALGFIRHEKGKRVQGDELAALEKQTGISQKDAEKRFPDPRRIHVYKVREFVPLTRAISIDVPGEGDRIAKFTLTESEQQEIVESEIIERGEGVGPRRLEEARFPFQFNEYLVGDLNQHSIYSLAWHESDRIREIRFMHDADERVESLRFDEGIDVAIQSLEKDESPVGKFVRTIHEGSLEVFADNPLMLSARLFSENVDGAFALHLSTENEGLAVFKSIKKGTAKKEQA